MKKQEFEQLLTRGKELSIRIWKMRTEGKTNLVPSSANCGLCFVLQELDCELCPLFDQIDIITCCKEYEAYIAGKLRAQSSVDLLKRLEGIDVSSWIKSITEDQWIREITPLDYVDVYKELDELETRIEKEERKENDPEES